MFVWFIQAWGNNNAIEIDQFSSGQPSPQEEKVKENVGKENLLYQIVLHIIKQHSVFYFLSKQQNIEYCF